MNQEPMKDLFGNAPGQIPHKPTAKPDTSPSSELHKDVPQDVLRLFEEIALSLWRGGRRRFSARAIIHRIRWYHHVERGDDTFKCNNNWTPSMARWLVAKHPEMEEFFELRSSPATDEQ